MTAPTPESPAGEGLAWDVFAAPPNEPANPDLFSSNTLFGQPGIYPAGTPMTPAAGSAWTDASARGLLSADGQRSFDRADLVAALPDPSLRAALASLVGTAAESLVHAFGVDTTADRLSFGVPALPGRIVGPAAGAGVDARERVVNERYRFEHPTLLAPSLVHDLLWTPANNDHSAETILHAFVAIVHAQLIARDAGPAIVPTELARRQNSLTITLLHSRQPGSARITLIAPDGAGTVPGGAPSMQTPDFWSVPFGPPGWSEAPKALAAVLDALVPEAPDRPHPLRFDEQLGRWISDQLDPGDRSLGPWLPPDERWRVLRSLGLVGRR